MIHPVVLEFLSEFGGLYVVYADPRPLMKGAKRKFSFDPDYDYPDDIREYSRRAGTPLCVIGERFDQYVVLLMDAEGHVYWALGDLLAHMADSGDQAIEDICTESYAGYEIP